MLRGTATAVSSTEKYPAGKGLRIFPNQFQNQFVIESGWDIAGVIVWSMTGVKVFRVVNENRERLGLDQGHLDLSC